AGTRGFRSQDTLVVPAYRTGGRRLTTPLFVYRAEARAAPDASPEVIV
ncbi:MAG: hypothetical protein GWO02_01040, partial [Gammaproteobacteria bacterium]|nr:hypothetical protein [Gammaproteobacteria bacterium]